MARLTRILKEAGLWFLVMVVVFAFVDPPLSSRGILLFAAASLLVGLGKEFLVVRTPPRSS
jgi:hypothetical protein